MTYISLTQMETRRRLIDEERELKQARVAAAADSQRPRPRGRLRVRRLLALADER